MQRQKGEGIIGKLLQSKYHMHNSQKQIKSA